MKLKNDLFLAKVLNTELKYQFLKNTPRFQKSDKESVRNAKRYLASNARSSVYVNSMIYGSLSVFFGFGSIATKSVIPGDYFILFLLLLILAIMSDTQFYRGIWDMRLLTPLTQLPIKVERKVVPFSLFLYNEFYLPFVTLPAGIIISVERGSPIPIAVFLLFTILFIYIARLISLILGVTFVKTNTNRKTKRLYLGQIFQVLIFVVFILSIEIATNQSYQTFIKIPQFLYYFIPVTTQYLTTLSFYPFAAFTLLFALVYPTYSFVQKRSFTEKMETFADVTMERKARLSLRLKKPVGSLIDKDFKLVLRRRGAIMIMVLPITFIIPIIPELLSTSASSLQYSFYVPYVSSVFLIDLILLVGLEGKAAWHLSALPITRRQFLFSKLVAIFGIGMVYYAVLIVIIAFANRGLVSYMLINYPFFALILTSVLFAGGSYLVNAIPNEVYSLSQEGIGGRRVFLKTFLIALPIILLNALIFAGSKYILTFHVSNYLKGYSLTIVLDAFVSLLFLRLFVKRGDHF